MTVPVIAIGLDAADPRLIERWISQGHLKNIKTLQEKGAYGRLKTYEYYRAETPWTTFLTGMSPKKLGYWGQLKYCHDTYVMKDNGSYNYDVYKPFYALDPNKKVAVIDMPQVCLSEDVNGIQVLAWGAHSPRTASCSKPNQLFDELVNQHGSHPVLRKDGANIFDVNALDNLKESLKIGIKRRANICKDILQREPWDCLLTIFGETHSVGHYFWHLSQSDHPLYKEFSSKFQMDPVLEVFQAIDEAIGEIISRAPSESQVVVFAAHGMGSNIHDLPSMLFLPELLYRLNFPGKVGIGSPDDQTGCDIGQSPANNKVASQGWAQTVWDLKYEANPVKRLLRRYIPRRIFKRVEKYFDSPEYSDLVSPFWLKNHNVYQPFQPANWYSKLWPQMKAFALPSFSEGYIRINLKGRDSQGIVAPSEYNSVCEEITEVLYKLQNARTGKPIVKKVVRTRELALDNDPKLPDADLVVIWQEDTVADVVDSPDVGRIGPVPFLRTGSHRADGFFIAKGAGIEPGTTLKTGHSIDLAPTFVNLMGTSVPEYFEGKPLIEVQSPVA